MLPLRSAEVRPKILKRIVGTSQLHRGSITLDTEAKACLRGLGPAAVLENWLHLSENRPASGRLAGAPCCVHGELPLYSTTRLFALNCEGSKSPKEGSEARRKHLALREVEYATVSGMRRISVTFTLA